MLKAQVSEAELRARNATKVMVRIKVLFRLLLPKQQLLELVLAIPVDIGQEIRVNACRKATPETSMNR